MENLFEKTGWYEKDRWEKHREPWMKYHLTPPVGWLNDPNGLCQFGGLYHVFFQYTPADASGKGGYKGWGHYTSPDLITWKYEGFAVAPDTVYEKDGAYSGSALIDEGKMYLYYTGNVKEPGDHDYIVSGRQANTLLIVSEDGYPGEDAKKRLLLTNADYPADCSCHVRDPKVWKEEDGFYMVQGARTRESKGEVLLYHSEDKLNWQFVGEITTETPFGYMWECPDLFKLEENTYLSVSPQGLAAEEYRYQNIYQSGYFRLEGDYRKDCCPVDFTEWDMGFDFYAPQTFEDEKGRRILFGWVGMPDAEYRNPTVDEGWQHCLTVPRQITEHNGKLYQNPVEELKQLRDRMQELSQDILQGREIITSGAYELFVENKESSSPLTITISEGVCLAYDGKKELALTLTETLGAGRNSRKTLISELKNVRLYVDLSVIEIFINDGELTLTTRFYPKTHTLKIDAAAAAGTLWEMKSGLCEET